MMMKDLEKPLTTKGLRPSWTYRGAKIEQKYRFSQLTDNQHLLKNHFTTPCDCYLFASRLLSFRLSIAIFSQADGGFIASPYQPVRHAKKAFSQNQRHGAVPVCNRSEPQTGILFIAHRYIDRSGKRYFA